MPFRRFRTCLANGRAVTLEAAGLGVEADCHHRRWNERAANIQRGRAVTLTSSGGARTLAVAQERQPRLARVGRADQEQSARLQPYHTATCTRRIGNHCPGHCTSPRRLRIIGQRHVTLVPASSRPHNTTREKRTAFPNLKYNNTPQDANDMTGPSRGAQGARDAFPRAPPEASSRPQRPPKPRHERVNDVVDIKEPRRLVDYWQIERHSRIERLVRRSVYAS